MPRKKAPAKSSPGGPKRHAISLEYKLAMIKRYEKGEKMVAIARAYGLSRTTVSTIIHDKERILTHIQETAPGMKSTVITKKRGKIIQEMEHLLSFWLERQTRQRNPINQMIIQEKALSLFNDLKKKYPDNVTEDFKASSGWFMRFKQRHNLYNVKVPGESTSAVTDADKQPLTNEELMKLHEQQQQEEAQQPEPELRHFTINKMQQAFVYMEKSLTLFEEMDPNAERFAKIMGAVHDAYVPYRVILEDMKSKTIQGTLEKLLLYVESRRSELEKSDDKPIPSTSMSTP
ncbi:CENPB DNA-binding domain-containing protein 1-like [Octopus sinensis]|uniref:CENPB DNA-binding domain-containing protein 1-like n=1 Tax=Octopus sinensis TaxID=2607531 RepID=A0A6P7T0C9_9MOLL|nr:CENPB DNA-binding domain-containing protein 1-like [Octopus sinensis]XP_036364218.1 CENPB DNA-binding domain-containing protein 1-like [Octopus sinensis]XP_036364219.1 CENPB DNA-binding domain-containing protein 1-like [Octopus sinensis]